MRALLLIGALLFLISGQQTHASDCKYWRLGGSYVHLVNENTRDIFGDAWGLVGEYSFNDALTSGERIGDGDLSIAVFYRRFDEEVPGVRNTADYTSFGFKWRGGAGASPSCDGLYAGVGVAAAMLRIQPDPFDGGPHYGVVKFQYSVFGGVNFARCLYLEVGYTNIPQISDLNFQEFTATFGGRF